MYIPVLIVGGGPAGLATSILLSTFGVRSMLVERRDGTSTHPEVSGIDTRTIELLASWAVEEPAGTRSLEEILLERTRKLAHADIRFETTVVHIEQLDDCVQVLVREANTRRAQRITASYVIGADGISGCVRRAAAIGLIGTEGIAERFRNRRLFLVGDAAHGMTPSGGMGLNAAIHDARNLAWKLAGVIQGWAGDALLDTYEAERKPRAERNLENATGSAHVGGRAPHVWLDSGWGRLSALDLFGSSFVLLSAGAGQVWRDAAWAAAQSLDVPLSTYRIGDDADLGDPWGQWASIYGVEPTGAVLVRPDGVIAWRAATASKSARGDIFAALAQSTSREIVAQRSPQEELQRAIAAA